MSKELAEQLLIAPMAALDDLCCGCGDPGMFFQAAKTILEYCSLEAMSEARKAGWIYEEPMRYFVANALDHLDLIEHGSSIGGSWLTEKGRAVLDFLNREGCEWQRGRRWVDEEGCERGES